MDLVVKISKDDYEAVVTDYLVYPDSYLSRTLEAVKEGISFTKLQNNLLQELRKEILKKVIRKSGVDSGEPYDYEYITSEEVLGIIDKYLKE